MARSAFVPALALCGLLLGCTAPESGDAPQPPLWVRTLCALQRWIEREDFRVRDEGVDRCAAAGRQISSGAERAREVLTDDGVEEAPEQ